MKDINFLKKENVIESLSKKKGSKNLMGSIFFIASILVVGSYILIVSYDWFLGFRVKSMNNEMSEYQEVVTLETESTRYRNSIDNIEKLIDKSQKGIRYRTDTFKIIADNCPDKIKMKNYEIDDKNKWKIVGSCVDKEPIVQYAEKLRKSGKFNTVDLRNIGSVGIDDKDKNIKTVISYEFTIELTE